LTGAMKFTAQKKKLSTPCKVLSSNKVWCPLADALRTFSVAKLANLDNVFIPKSLEKQSAKNKAINKDIDEWIDRAESME